MKVTVLYGGPSAEREVSLVSGKAVIDLEDDQLSFEGPNCILGRGLVVHEKADDLKTPPAGNAGGRLAVAIIGVAQPR